MHMERKFYEDFYGATELPTSCELFLQHQVVDFHTISSAVQGCVFLTYSPSHLYRVKLQLQNTNQALLFNQQFFFNHSNENYCDVLFSPSTSFFLRVAASSCHTRNSDSTSILKKTPISPDILLS